MYDCSDCRWSKDSVTGALAGSMLTDRLQVRQPATGPEARDVAQYILHISKCIDVMWWISEGCEKEGAFAEGKWVNHLQKHPHIHMKRGGERRVEIYTSGTFPPLLAEWKAERGVNMCSGSVHRPSGKNSNIHGCGFQVTWMHYSKMKPTLPCNTFTNAPFTATTRLPFNLLGCVLLLDIQQYKGTFNNGISQSGCWLKTVECQNNGDSFVTPRPWRWRGGEMFCCGIKTRQGKDQCDCYTERCLCLRLHYHRQFVMCCWHHAVHHCLSPTD